MKDFELDMRLDRWSEQIAARVPDKAPERTPDCLTFSELTTIESGNRESYPQAKRDHIDQCAWCRRALAMVAREEARQYDSQYDFHYNAEVAQSSMDMSKNPVTATMLAHVGAWLRENAIPMESESPAYFDEEGTLHVAMQGLKERGQVRVSLLYKGASVNVGLAEAVDGVLKLSKPMQECDARNIRVPAELVTVHALGQRA